MLYGIECWVVENQYEKKNKCSKDESVVWMCGKTRWDIWLKITTLERIEASLIVKKMVKNMLRLFEHVEKKHVNFVIKRVDQIKSS